uniref:Ovule protein n=1 Tax=Ascaris lumbricoides TaxID=6252 RepID=A0A0M3HVC8_ASCLU
LLSKPLSSRSSALLSPPDLFLTGILSPHLLLRLFS